MNFYKDILLKISRFSLLLLFIAYYSNITFFYHTHIVDGNLICHSHWYNDFDSRTPVDSHSHTAQGYLLIHFLEESSYENDLFIPFINTPQTAVRSLFVHLSDNKYAAVPFADVHLRAPPFLI